MSGTLYVAGDSFACLVKNQPKGNSWSELVASGLNMDLCNVSRSAASNFSIAIQVEWIIGRVTKDDLIIVFLTDHKRKTLPDLNVKRDPDKSILELHSLHPDQRKIKDLNFSDKPRLISSHIHHSGPTKSYYRDWFDEEIQELENTYIVTGMLAKLSKATKNFVVCSGWFGKNATAENFCIPSQNFLNVSADNLINWSSNSEYQNHLDDMTHLKFSRLIFNHLRKHQFK